MRGGEDDPFNLFGDTPWGEQKEEANQIETLPLQKGVDGYILRMAYDGLPEYITWIDDWLTRENVAELDDQKAILRQEAYRYVLDEGVGFSWLFLIDSNVNYLLRRLATFATFPQSEVQKEQSSDIDLDPPELDRYQMQELRKILRYIQEAMREHFED